MVCGIPINRLMTRGRARIQEGFRCLRLHGEMFVRNVIYRESFL